MDTAIWPQETVVKQMEDIMPNACTKPNGVEKKAISRPQKEQILNCPRCNSTNTKFCYYNNYSRTQPRYFCKTCRRYWTEGGSLRNIPVGGGSRKNNKRPNSSLSSSTPPSKKLHDLSSTQNPSNNIHEGQDLNLAFPNTQDFRTISDFTQLPSSIENSNKNNRMPSNASPAASTSTSHLSALELLGGITSRGFNSFMHMPISDPNTIYTSGFSMQDFKPTLNFSFDGLGNNGYVSAFSSGQETGSGKTLFSFEDLRQVSSTTNQAEQNRGQGDSTGYWTGMLGGGSW